MPQESGDFLGYGAFDFQKLRFVQSKTRSTENSVDLCRAANSDNRARDGWVVQRPGDCDFAGRAAVAIADLAEQFHQAQIPRKGWLLELGTAPPPIVGRE